MLLNPTGWAKTALTADEAVDRPADLDHRERARPCSPPREYVKNSRHYYQYKSQEELTAWNNLFLPITQGA